MSTDGPPEEQPIIPPPGDHPSAQTPIDPAGGQPIEPPPGYAAPPPGGPPQGPPPGFTPVAAPAPSRSNVGQFILGLALGAIPLVLALAGVGSVFNTTSSFLGNLLTAGAIGFLIGLVLSIILTIVRQTRRVGLGMLTAILASPVIFFIGCLVMLAHPFPAGGTST